MRTSKTLCAALSLALSALSALSACGRPACATNGCATGQVCLESGCVELCLSDAGFGGEGSCPAGTSCGANTQASGACGGAIGTCESPEVPAFVCN